MKVKRYEAPTLQEALLNVKRELGSDAVILQTRKFNRGGLFGFLKNEVVEVIAATEVNTAGSPAPLKRPASRPPQQQELGIGQRMPAASSPYRKSGNGDDDRMRDELREVKETLHTLMKQNSRDRLPVPSRDSSPFPPIFGDIYLRLLENDIEDKLAQDIIRSMDENLPKDRAEDDEYVYAALTKQLRRLIKITGAIQLTPGETKTVAFAGPTGVGKTTTIAKLATIFSLSHRKKVGIITADTFRIAAVEQIKVYGEIIDVPIRVVYNGEDMRHALDYFSDRDIVLIDTAGRSHWDTEKIQELRNLLAVCYPLEIHLVVAANTRYKDMLDIADRFRPLAFNNLVFTKLDETSTYGNLTNLTARCNTGVSYISFGQNVPGEIQEASVETLMSLTVGEPLSRALKVRKN